MLYPVKQLNLFLLKYHSHFTCTPSLTYIALVHDCFLTGLLASVICCQPFPHLNLSLYNPSCQSPVVPEHALTV